VTPGSTLWLLRHELRLAWRAGDEKTRWVRLVLFAFLLLMMSAAGIPFSYLLRGHAPVLNGAVVVGAAGAFGFISVMSFATSLSFTAASFIDRGDIDLLLSSPLPMRRLLTVRLAATALRSAALWLMLFGPPFLTIAWMAGPRWLCGLLLLIIAGLVGTALSTWLAVGLFKAMGARQVKSTTTVITALSGLSMGLTPALFNARFSGADRGREIGTLFDRLAARPFAPDSVASLPARVLYGETSAVLLLGGLALALFAVTTWLLAPSFAAIAIQGDPQRRRPAGDAPLRGFGGGLFGKVLLKDYRLLLRNHALMLQILARSVAFVPLLVINLSRPGEALDLAQVAGAVTLVLGQTGGATVWAFIAAETQPDLPASSPHPASLFRRSRLAAGLLPALALVIAAAAAMAPRSPPAALSVLLVGAAACLSSAAINSMAKAIPGRRGGWGNAPRASLPAQFTDMAAGGAWAAAAWLLAKGSIWTPVPVWLGLSVVWLWREFSRSEPAGQGK
jgi:ABC-2 type transport system permease protein